MNPQLPNLYDHLRPALQGKKILLGITGSVAAFKACDIVRGLKSCGAQVRCVLTPSGARFVTALTLENLSGEPVATSLWREGAGTGEDDDESPALGTHHIATSRWADAILIAPATAHVMAKLAHGLADDLLSTEALAFLGPILVAPAMNPAMFDSPATVANRQTLLARGVRLLGPTQGVTACGEEGLGRMIEPDEILERVDEVFHARPNGKRLLVTLGPTRARLDPVRYLTNRSSGLMGASIAWAAACAGFDVTIVAGPCDAILPRAATVHRVQTAHEMLERASAAFERADVFVSAAAVLDWEAAEVSANKLKKDMETPTLELRRGPDILATLSARKRPGQYVVGFAAETRDVLEQGRQKRIRKNCDALFANDVSLPSQGLESPANAGWWIDAHGAREFALSSKAELARELVELIGRAHGAGPSPASNARVAGPSPASPRDSHGAQPPCP